MYGMGVIQSPPSGIPSADPSQQSIPLQVLNIPLYRALGNADQFSQLGNGDRRLFPTDFKDLSRRFLDAFPVL